MDIQFVNVKGDPDKDKVIFVDGVKVGTVGRGWLRLGGEQWVVSSAVVGSCWGESTLKEVKRRIAHKLK